MVFGCCFAVFALIIGLAIAAAILRAACGFAGTEVPEFSHAMMVVFVMGVIQAGVNLGINFAFGIPIIDDINTTPPDMNAVLGASLASIIINIPLQMLMIWKLVPTPSFGKAALVWVIQFLIVLAIVAIIVGAIFVFMMASTP